MKTIYLCEFFPRTKQTESPPSTVLNYDSNALEDGIILVLDTRIRKGQEG